MSHSAFQPTLPHGERPHSAKYASIPAHFNPRSRMGSDQPNIRGALTGVIFQPTLPHGERRNNRSCVRYESYFNPRSRMGSDIVARDTCIMHNISTHAPAWGATPSKGIEQFDNSISTHAPAWGATTGGGKSGAQIADFNPRSRMGSDLGNADGQPFRTISTHAPAWGATLHGGHAWPADRYFNPRSRMGSDLAVLADMCNSAYFNPRSRMGSDRFPPARKGYKGKFQPTLPHGERQPQQTGMMCLA